MYIIFVRNYKRRFIYLLLAIMAWAVLFFASKTLFSNNFNINLTVDNFFSFNCPLKFDINNIYVNEMMVDNSIQTSSNFKKPLAQRFTTYKSVKGKFSFEYPSAFELNEKQFEGSEILYHIGFEDKDNPIHGMVQVWNLPYDLKEFLEKSKSSSQQNFKQFNSKNITVNNIQGFYWDYVIQTKEGKIYKGNEVFLKKDDKMYRISYFVPSNLWDKKQSDIFWTILSSFKTY